MHRYPDKNDGKILGNYSEESSPVGSVFLTPRRDQSRGNRPAIHPDCTGEFSATHLADRKFAGAWQCKRSQREMFRAGEKTETSRCQRPRRIARRTR